MLSLLILGQAAVADVERLIAQTRALTRATVECRAERIGDDVTVCARRDADKWRVPYLTPEPGDPRIIDAVAERTRLIAQPSNCTEMRLMAYGCGMMGVSVSANGRGVGVETPRPLAP